MAGIHTVHRMRIADFEQAVRRHEMMGAKHPSDHAAIQEEYDYTKQRLENSFINLYKRRDR